GIISQPAVPAVAAPRAGVAAEAGPAHALLREDELELLERFLARAAEMDAARRDDLAARLAARFRAHIGAQDAALPALRRLYESERAARDRGAAGRDETGAARERYALIAEGEPRWSRFAAKLAEV